MNNIPILYSFRRCPYAMRARLGLYEAGLRFELREILLKDKPSAFLAVSDDATVPVLVNGNEAIQESLDILLWALGQRDPDHLLSRYDAEWVRLSDEEFKPNLDRYKYSSRWAKGEGEAAREKAMAFLYMIEERLKGQSYLHGDKIGASDLAILPFIRQFAHVDLNWFNQQDWNNLKEWLSEFKSSALFTAIMEKRPPWQAENSPLYFGQYEPGNLGITH